MPKSTRQKQRDQFDVEVQRWDVAMNGSDTDEALRHAAKALQIAASAKDLALQKAAGVYVQVALARSAPDSNESANVAKVTCSFCGRTRDQARLLVGADGQICEYCSENVSRYFADDTSRSPRT